MSHHRVVHQDVDCAEAAEQVGHHGFNGGALRQIGSDADGIDAELCAKTIPGFGRFDQIMQDNICSRAGKAFGHGQAQARRCPGHECPFALQHRLLPLLLVQFGKDFPGVTERLDPIVMAIVPRATAASAYPRISTPAHSSSTFAIEVKSEDAPYLALVMASICRTTAPQTIGTPMASASS